MRKITFAEGVAYHVYNRGTDRREIFSCDSDRYRFITDLAYMNTSKHILFPREHMARTLRCPNEIGSSVESKLVDIHAFTLMPNHFHLMVSQRVANGISTFMHKLGTAYTMYFNKKYPHSGVLFQGRYKAAQLNRAAYFDHLPFYIHANPLKLAPKGLTTEAKLEYLHSYKWSSFGYYCGKNSFGEVLSPGLLTDYFTEYGGFLPYITRKLETYDEAQPQGEARPRDEAEPLYI